MNCEYLGCLRQGCPCFLPDDDPDHPSHHYCSEHAQNEGFCSGCGGFFSGIESFDFGPGLCETCLAEEDGLDDWDEDETDDELISEEDIL